MLTNVTEGYQKKCEQYWPESKQNEEYGPFEVTVVDQKVFADYTVRIMQLEVSSYFAFKELHKCTWEIYIFFSSNPGWWVSARRLSSFTSPPGQTTELLNMQVPFWYTCAGSSPSTNPPKDPC